MKIKVDQDDIEPHKIYVTLREANAQVSTLLNEVFFALTLDEADKLAFQLNSVLQDIERNAQILR